MKIKKKSISLLFLTIIFANSVFAKKDTLQMISYSANRTDISETITFRDDNRFLFRLYYGSLTLVATGTWEQQNDSIFLTTTTESQDYDIKLYKNDTIPKGKIAIHFQCNARILHYHKYRLDTTQEFKKLDNFLETNSGFMLIVNRPKKSLHLELKHNIYHKIKKHFVIDIPLKKKVNEFYISMNREIAVLQFKRLPFFIKENTLLHNATKNNFVFTNLYTKTNVLKKNFLTAK